MPLVIYSNPVSQPCRAVELFMKVNKIPYERILAAGDELKKVAPFGGAPFLDHDGFQFSESGAMMRYLMSQFEVPEHWYPPSDPKRRARVDEAIGWSHSALHSLRHYSLLYYWNKLFFAPRGKGFDEERVRLNKEGFKCHVTQLEDIMLKDTPFVFSDEITIADLSIFSELIQLQLLNCSELLDGHTKTLEYIERVKERTKPAWDEMFVDLDVHIKPVLEFFSTHKGDIPRVGVLNNFNP